MGRHSQIGTAVLLAVSCVAANCSGSPPESPAPGPVPGPVQITGTERLGWDQPASSPTELAALRYRMYIDGVAVQLEGVQCNVLAGGTAFPCDVPLPALAPGAHSLTLSALFAGDTGLESPQSAPLQVLVATGASQMALGGRSAFAAPDGTPVGVHLFAAGLSEPTDIAVASTGRVFVAERSGRIVVFDGDPLQPTATLQVPEVHTAGRGGLLALAVDPGFRDNGLLFAVYTTIAGFEVSRFRLVADSLGERLVLVHDVEPSFLGPAAALRFGVDGKLFVALDDGADPNRAGDPGSFNGKVLRLNPDGSTPADQVGGSPVYVMNVNDPRGIDWNSQRGTMWILERDPDGVDRVQAIADETTGGRRGSATMRYSLPAGIGASDLAVYRHDLFPDYRDNLLVAGGERRGILRLGVDPGDPTRIVSTEWLLQDAVGAVRALAVGLDGMIYICTADSLLSLSPN